jgi:hypothetical protein
VDNEGGGESEIETETEIFASVEYLSQIPPDWEAAEKHGLASLVYDENIVKSQKLENC